MRIAVDVSAAFSGPSGATFYVQRLVEAMARLYPQHDFVLTCASWRVDSQWDLLDLPTGPNISRIVFKVPQRLFFPAQYFFGLSYCEGAYLKAGIDIFYGLGNTLPLLRRIPAVLTVHHVGGEIPFGLWNHFYYRMLIPDAARRAKGVIAISDFTRTELSAEWGIDPNRVVRVYPGGPNEDFRPFAPTDDVSPIAGPYLLHVGALVSRKNVVGLLRAYAQVLERAPELPHRLVLVGRDGDASAEVNRIIATTMILRERVVRTGMVDHRTLLSLYRGAAAFVLPCVLDGFSFPALEAMACAVPAVVRSGSALTEVVGDAALLCDDISMSSALLEVMTNEEVREGLRRRGLARVKKFSWDLAAHETMAVLRAAAQ